MTPGGAYVMGGAPANCRPLLTDYSSIVEHIGIFRNLKDFQFIAADEGGHDVPADWSVLSYSTSRK